MQQGASSPPGGKPAPVSPPPSVTPQPQPQQQATATGPSGQPYQVVKAPGNDTVYIVREGKKYAIAGAKDFEDLGLNWRNIKEIPASQLNSYAQGGTVNQSNVASYKQQLLGKQDPVQQIISSTAKPPQASPQPPVPTTPQPQPAPTGSPGQPYQLVKAANDPKIYLVKDRIKHHVESPKDIANLGLDLNKVQTISANDLNKYTKGDAINQSNVASYRQQISGQPQPLKQVASGPQQVKPLQVSPQAAPTASQSQQLVTATGQAGQKTSQLKSEIEDIQQKAVALVTGTPAPGSGTGVKTALAGPSSNVTTMPITPQISSAGSNSQSYQFVKADNDPKVYLVKDGIKHHIEGVKDVTDLGLDLNKVQTVPAAQLNFVHERDPINQSNVANYKQQISGKQQTPLNFSPPVTTSPSGTKASGSEFNQAYQLVKSKDSPTVYILKDGKKYAIQSVEEFNKRGLDWNKIQTVADPFLNQLNKEQRYWCGEYVRKITERRGEQLPSTIKAGPNNESYYYYDSAEAMAKKDSNYKVSRDIPTDNSIMVLDAYGRIGKYGHVAYIDTVNKNPDNSYTIHYYDSNWKNPPSNWDFNNKRPWDGIIRRHTAILKDGKLTIDESPYKGNLKGFIINWPGRKSDPVALLPRDSISSLP
jgi:surface antigen